MQTLITDVCWTKRGVRRFTDKVNEYLSQGWKVCHVSIEKRGLRMICHAVLVLKG